MVRKILKAILWRLGLLSRVQEILWKPVKTGNGVTTKQLESNLVEFPLNFDDEEINKSFERENNIWVSQKDYLLQVDNCVVEPARGLAIISNNEFLSQMREHTYVFPDKLAYLKYKRGKTPVKELDEAVHIDGYLSISYYHVFRDLMTSLGAIKALGLSDKPLIIGGDVYASKHFQWILANRPWVKSLNWQILDGRTYLRVKRLYKFVSLIPDANTWKQARDIMSPPFVAEPQRRIYLYRAGNFGRTVNNMEEIKPVLEKYGFELVDTGNMTVDEQMDLFANTRYLVAIHGAGITNILFCNPDKFSLLEILPGREKLNSTFYWMAVAMHHKYDALLTADMDADKRFRLEPDVLEKHIKRLVEE